MAQPKNTGLGRGLDAIFKDNFTENDENVSSLRIAEIEPRADQPRKTFDDDTLAELAASISEHGVLQPLLVNKTNYGSYRIIAGERRWRAARMAGLTEVPVIIMDLDEKAAAEVSIIENIQREDLNPLEEADAYRSLIDEYGLTQEELAKRLGKSRSAVANSLRLCDLPKEAKDLLGSGKLSAGHARALLGLRDRDCIGAAARRVVLKNLSVRQTEALVKRLNAQKPSPEKKEDLPEIDYSEELSRFLTKKFGRKINIVNRNRAKKIEIEFTNDKDLNETLEKLFGNDIFDNQQF